MLLATKIMTAAAALVLATAPVTPRAQATVVPSVALASVTPTTSLVAVRAVQDAKVDIRVDDDRGGAWYTNPVWIAIGIIALVLIIALIAMAGRGRDTTVVK